jgi:hypothetical protein
MNRRDALLAILTAPAGVPYALAQDKEIGSVTRVSSTTYMAPRIVMQLADKEGDGICVLEVRYKGEIQTFSAEEIWDALAGKERKPAL